MRVVVLMEYASENGIEIIREFKRLNIPIHSIICIGHYYPKNRNELLRQRTGGQYKRPWFSALFVDNPVPIYLVDDVNSNSCYDLIQSLEVDLLVSEGSKIIRKPIFDLPKFGMLNVHAALLPYFRGCSCLEWSILQDFPLGVTCHFLVRSVDSGPIIERVELQHRPHDTYTDLRTKTIFLVGYAMGRAVHRIVNGGFRFKDGLKHDKGPWFVPIKDLELIAKVRNKIDSQTYCPKVIEDDFPLITVDVELPLGKITIIKRKQ